jgi:hypothetical protein
MFDEIIFVEEMNNKNVFVIKLSLLNLNMNLEHREFYTITE